MLPVLHGHSLVGVLTSDNIEEWLLVRSAFGSTPVTRRSEYPRGIGLASRVSREVPPWTMPRVVGYAHSAEIETNSALLTMQMANGDPSTWQTSVALEPNFVANATWAVCRGLGKNIDGLPILSTAVRRSSPERPLRSDRIASPSDRRRSPRSKA